MTNVSPNNQILPQEWLVESDSIGTIRTKVRIDLFEANNVLLAQTIDNYMSINDKTKYKQQAYELGFNNFAPTMLKEKYLEIISQI
jgi:hypothetical protein